MKTKSLPWILLLCTAALGLRLWGLGWMLPQRMEPDAQVVVQTRILHDADREQAEWFGTYGLFTAYAAALLPAPRQAEATADMSLSEHRRNASAEVVRVRLAVALLSLLIIPATWWLARQALGAPAALLATALMATSLLHLSMSQQARPHGVACALYLLAVLAALHLRRRPDWRAYVLAGITAGLAGGALQSGLSVLPALAVAHLFRERGRGPSSFWRILVPIAIVVALLAFFYPLLVGQTVSMFQVDGGSFSQGAHRVRLDLFNGKGLPHMLWSLWSYEPTILILGAVGLPLALARLPRSSAGRRDLLVALAFALPYVAAFGIFEGFQERMLLPLLPYLAVLAAFPLDTALRRSPTRARPAVAAVALLVLAFPAAMALKLSALRTTDDTLEQAADWIAEHAQVEEDVVLVTFPLDLPLFQDDAALAINREVIPDVPDFYPRLTRWFKYQSYDVQARLAPERPAAERFGLVYARPAEYAGDAARAQAALERSDARYAVVELFGPEREVPGNTRIAENIAAQGRRVARFAPWRDVESSDLPFEHEGLPSHRQAHVVGYLLAAERMGPVIEVYELR